MRANILLTQGYVTCYFNVSQLTVPWINATSKTAYLALQAGILNMK